MALPDYARIIKKKLPSLAVLALCLVTAVGCGNKSNAQVGAGEVDAATQNPVTAQPKSKHVVPPQSEAELPVIDGEAVVAALPWIVDTLALEKQYRKDDFQIDNYEISPDKRYVIANISNGARSGTSGPFYRFLVFNPKAKRIFFPSMSILRSDNLGYPYIAAKFNDRDQVAIAQGYRSITGSIVVLPEGKILSNREIDVFDTKEIEKALARMLEQGR